MKTKICTGVCGLEKHLSEFGIRTLSPDGYQYKCKECRKIDNKIYYDKNRQEILKRKKKYSNKNKERIAQYCKEWYEINKDYCNQYYQDNKEEKIKYQIAYQKLKRETNIQFKLYDNLRGRLRLALKGKNKSLSTMFLIGCEIDYLMYHLQSKFTKGMNWDNYGAGWHGKKEWNIDHIKPCASFDLSKPSEQLKCFNYTNLQPLWAIDNLRKGNKIIK